MDLATVSDDEAVEMVRQLPILHFATMERIENKAKELVEPVPNILQIRIYKAYELCRKLNIPCRLMILKPRQVGCSTACAHLCYHHTRRHNCNGMVIGDEDSRTGKAWQMLRDYETRDRFEWGFKVDHNTETMKFRYDEDTVGLWERDTANDPKAGIGGTRQILWFTEAARYAKSGTRTDANVITAALNSLSKLPGSDGQHNTLGILESTADGAAGYFYDNWQRAIPLEDVERGVFEGNGWIKIFAAWFEFTEHQLSHGPTTARYFKTDMIEREQRGVKLYGWTMAQVAWRRATIENECGNDERRFDQDYPENDEDCFLGSGRPRFNSEGVTRLEQMSKAAEERRRKGLGALMGVLEKGPGGVMFRQDSDAPWLWMIEKPILGCSYIVSVDPCSGEQSAGAMDPDSHAVAVVRRPYQGPDGKFHDARVVALIDVLTGCRWDDDLVAKRTVMLADLYGGPKVVCETGNGFGVINKLRDYGATLYMREKMDAIVPGLTHNVVGWETTEQTRDLWVGAVAEAVREQSILIEHPIVVSQIRTFVINARGKAEAKSGKHDDWVTSLGLALFTGPVHSSVYRPMKTFQTAPAQRAGAFS